MSDTPELMRLADAARSLGLKPSSLKTEIRRGRLTPVQIAGRLSVQMIDEVYGHHAPTFQQNIGVRK